MSLILEHIIDDDSVFSGGAAIPCLEDMPIVIAGARVKFPKSMLSLFHIIPRTMSRYNLELVNTENIVGGTFTTAYNIRRNMGITSDPLTIKLIEKYFLDSANEVLTLMIRNTSFSNLKQFKKKGKRNNNPVIFRSGSSPLLLIIESKTKQISIYKEDTSKQNDSYTPVGENVALVSKYAGITLLDVHTPSKFMELTAIYGIKGNNTLKKLSTDKDLKEYQESPLSEPVRLNDFINLFESIKQNIPMTSVPVSD
ncbi:DNA-binding virion core protein [Pteropox virus]|uniref:Core protein VP8 n=1 Tax=Pteropox virus TaxID=1873698 RepID=A0A1B1MRG1_9POXV|nr:DNA-binding virion core protein [Pteropox virus]ANS71152.1 DNA-binding virion core protein [Pteropox virus]